jgi:putative YhbY family RNA-binding protein
MKLELPADERRALRAKAHPLHPVVMIGHDGLTPAVLHEIDVNLSAHGLIKIRVFSDDRAAREDFLARVADQLDAAAVQHIGKLLIVYRPLPKPEPEPGRKRAVPAKAPSGYLSRTGARRTTQSRGEDTPAIRPRKTPRTPKARDGAEPPGIHGRRRPRG